MPAELPRRDPNIGALPRKARYGVSGGLKAGGAALLLATLAGCGDDNAAQSSLRCPQIVIPAETAVYDLVRNNSTSPKDVLAEARITNTRGDCTYGDKSVAMDVEVEFTVWRGPAAWLEKDFPAQYTVTVGNAQGQVLGSAVHDLKLPMPKLQITPRETLQVPLDLAPIPISGPGDGAATKIAIGFQVSPQQREFNKARAAGVASQAAQPVPAGGKTVAPVVPDPRAPNPNGPPQ